MNSIVICGLVLALGLCAIADEAAKDGFVKDWKAIKEAICVPDKLDAAKLDELKKCSGHMAGKGHNISEEKKVLFLLLLYTILHLINLKIFLLKAKWAEWVQKCKDSKEIKPYLSKIKDDAHIMQVCMLCNNHEGKGGHGHKGGKGGDDAAKKEEWAKKMVCY